MSRDLLICNNLAVDFILSQDRDSQIVLFSVAAAKQFDL